MKQNNELRDLEAWIAEHVFHWEWFERSNENGLMLRGLFPPVPLDENNGWYRANFYPDFQPAAKTTTLFSDWDQLAGFRVSGRTVKRGLPEYTSDLNAAAEVLEQCHQRLRMLDVVEDDLSLRVVIYADSVTVYAANHLGECRYQVTGDGVADLPVLICQFAQKLFGHTNEFIYPTSAPGASVS